MVSIDSKKGMAVKGYFPEEGGFWYQHFKFSAKAHLERLENISSITS